MSQEDFLRLPPADNLMGKEGEGLGVNHSHLHQGLHPCWRVWPYFHHFLGSLEVYHQIRVLNRSWVGATALEAQHEEFLIPAPAEAGAESPKLSHTHGHDLKITNFQTFLRNTEY